MFDPADVRKQLAAKRWHAELWRTRQGRISFQVFHEFYWKMLKKWPGQIEVARSEIRRLQAWRSIAPSGGLIEDAWRIQDRYRLSFWDALIVAAALRQGCGTLLTEDLQHGQEIEGLRVVSPFLAEPESILNS